MSENDACDAFGTLVVIILFLSPTILIGFIAHNYGFQEGRKQVASGEVVCELVERHYKETEWVCRKPNA